MDVNSILKNSKKYDFSELKNELQKVNSSDLIYVLKLINYHVNLINQRGGKKSIKIRAFVEALNLYYQERNVETDFFEKIKLIESFYENILEERNVILENIKSEEIVATLFLLADRFYTRLIQHNDILHEKKFDFIEDILNTKTKFFDGKLIDSNIEELCTLFSLNMIISAYENKWVNTSNEIIIPIEIFSQEKVEENFANKIEVTNKIAVNSGLWDIVEDLDFRFRFFENEVIFKDKKITFSQKIFTELGCYAIIANKRFERLMTQNVVNIAPIVHHVIKNKGDKKISSIYMSTCAQFFNLYYVDINNDKKEYKGLTLSEWLKSIIALSEISKNIGFNLIQYNDLFSVLNSLGIPESKNKIILDVFTFKITSSDLYDAPILRFTDNSLLVFPISMWAPNYIYIINSIFSSNSLRLEDKGYDFEDEVVEFLRKKEKELQIFSVSNPKYIVKKEEYQFDAILDWDDYIFLIECKNRSVPNTKPISLKNFKEKSEDYINQIKRLQYGFEKHPNEHKIKLQDKIIVPIILNSLPFALDYILDGVYFLDYSSFSKFFNVKSLSLKAYDKHESRDVHIMHNNWAGDLPTVDDFLNYINKPYQVSELKSRLNSYETSHIIGGYNLILSRYYIDYNVGEFKV